MTAISHNTYTVTVGPGATTAGYMWAAHRPDGQQIAHGYAPTSEEAAECGRQWLIAHGHIQGDETDGN